MFHPSTRRRARRGRPLMTAAAGVLVAGALVLAVLGWRAHGHPASPPTSAAHPAAEGNLPAPTTGAPTKRTVHARSGNSTGPSGSTTSGKPSPQAIVGPTLDRSKPISLSIPAIGVEQADLAAYGTDSRGAIDIPPATGGVPAGWYTGSPTPGQPGPSVIVGHIDSAADGPSIFYHLAELRRGDSIRVTRSDDTVATFTVDSLESYPKEQFPTQRVYGNINHAGLRLISCTGAFDAALGHYEDNLVVYAHLTSTHQS